MYAIFEDGGRQYKVSTGDKVLVDLRPAGPTPSEVTFDQVLLVGEGAGSKVGTPLVSGAKVTGKVLEALKMPKVTGIKFSRRKGYKKVWGHRQPMLKIEITGISG